MARPGRTKAAMGVMGVMREKREMGGMPVPIALLSHNSH